MSQPQPPTSPLPTLIAGCSGSGKTTLARELATQITARFFSLVFLCFAATPVQAQHTRPPAKTSVPGFRVDVTYSPKAALELKRRHETVVIFGYTFGSPTKDAPHRIISKEGDIGLGQLHAEFQPGQIAEIPTLTLDQHNLKYLSSTGVQVLINVVSGRKSSPDNLLNCDIYEGPLQKIQSQTVPLHCKLIGE